MLVVAGQLTTGWNEAPPTPMVAPYFVLAALLALPVFGRRLRAPLVFVDLERGVRLLLCRVRGVPRLFPAAVPHRHHCGRRCVGFAGGRRPAVGRDDRAFRLTSAAFGRNLIRRHMFTATKDVILPSATTGSWPSALVPRQPVRLDYPSRVASARPPSDVVMSMSSPGAFHGMAPDRCNLHRYPVSARAPGALVPRQDPSSSNLAQERAILGTRVPGGR